MMKIVESIRSAIETEAVALTNLAKYIDQAYALAIQCLLDCQGKVIIIGVGKSGIIGRKMAASFSSTGKPALFVHAAEAVHGDSGVIEQKDLVILISNSGETQEVLAVLPIIKKIGSKRIAITSDKNSTLAASCDVILSYDYEREADHLNLAPTTSSVLALAIGDAIAVTLSGLNNFDKEQFYTYHPGGSLGEQLSSSSRERKGQGM